MKFKILNNEPLQFYDSNANLTGTIKISGSGGDLYITPESGSSRDVIIGNSTTVGDVEIGGTSSPVNLRLLGGGTLTSNGNTLYIGNAATNDTVIISNAIFTSSLQITGSLRVSGSAYAHYFVGDGSGLTNINASASIAIRDEGTLLTSSVASIDFVGTGVSASAVGGNVTVTINGGGGSTDTGSLLTTASFSNPDLTFTKGDSTTFVVNLSSLQPTTASYSLTASYAENAGTTIDTGSFVTTSSFNNFTSSYTTGSFTGSFSGSFNGTGSYALYSLTSSHTQYVDYANIGNKPTLISSSAQIATDISGAFTSTSASLSATINNVIATTVTTSSFNSFTSSYTTGSFTGSFFGNGSGLLGVISSSYAESASYALTSSYSISSSYATSASYAISSSHAETASLALSSLNASDILIYVKNTTGVPIEKGKVVRISGATGDNALIATASYIDDGNSANTLGILNETIADQAFGYAMTEGKLLGIDTDLFTAGQLLYLGPTGSIIGYEPKAPLHAVRLGQALRIQQNNGSMYVRIDNGYEIDELHNVLIVSGSDGDLLVASGSNFNGNKLYINSRQLTGSYGLTGSLNVIGSVTASFTGSLIGSLTGTASFASHALSSSYANNSTTASYANNAKLFDGNNTAVFATTASNTFKSDQIISGSLTITNDLTVIGSSSIQYITSSQLDVSTNIISVNTFSPSLRFGGLAVIDSGSSPQTSGSLLFDSQNNQWIFVHQDVGGSAITSSVLIMGPQTFNNLGNETTISTNRITKGTGGDLGEHIGDSNITDTGTVVSINSATEITGSLIVTNTITGSGLMLTGSTTSDLLRITQTGTGNALVVEDETNPDSSPFIVNASGFVGVGTYNPLSKFVISNNNSEGIEMGYAAGLTSNYLESFNRNTGFGVDMTYYISNTGAHRFYTNGIERIRIDNDGNVGVGTNSPTIQLDVQKSTGTGNQLVGRFLAGTNTNGSAGGITLGSTQTQAGYIYGVQTAASSGDLVFGNQYLGSYAESVRILANGNVGIGTTSPSDKLHVNGNVIISGSLSGITFDNPIAASAGLTFKSNGNSVWSINKGAGDASENWNFYNFSRSTIDFSVNNSTGYIGIGAPSPTEKLTVAGNIFANAGNNEGFKLNGGLSIYRLAGDDLGFFTANSESMRITSTGDIGIGKTSANAKLDVNGNAIISGSLTVTGSLRVGGIIFGDGGAQLTGTTSVSGSLVLSGSVTSQSGNTISSDALVQASLLYLSNNF